MCVCITGPTINASRVGLTKKLEENGGIYLSLELTVSQSSFSLSASNYFIKFCVYYIQDIEGCPRVPPNSYVVYFVPLDGRGCVAYRSHELEEEDSWLELSVSEEELPLNCQYSIVIEKATGTSRANSTGNLTLSKPKEMDSLEYRC